MLVSNIQRFCLHDGPGIRTTVFFMGCPLRCFWCCNPENMESRMCKYSKNGIDGFYGHEYSTEQLLEVLLRDRDFYSKDGGVTFSGGEFLLYLSDNINLLKKLKELDISICIETSLAVSREKIKPIIDYIDYFYIDLKVFTEKSSTIGFEPLLFFNNLKLLKKINQKIVFRIPLVKGFNDDNDNLCIIKNIIKDFEPSSVEIFQIHNLAKEKYLSLHMTPFTPIPFYENEINTIISFLSCEKIKYIQI